METADKIFEQVPGFQDIFDEESFYFFAILFTFGTLLFAFVASKFIKLKCKDWFRLQDKLYNNAEPYFHVIYATQIQFVTRKNWEQHTTTIITPNFHQFLTLTKMTRLDSKNNTRAPMIMENFVYF